jgi:hypothetical protein
MKEMETDVGKEIGWQDDSLCRLGQLIPPRLSWCPDTNSAIFEQQFYSDWHQNGNFLPGYQHHQGGIEEL